MSPPCIHQAKLPDPTLPSPVLPQVILLNPRSASSLGLVEILLVSMHSGRKDQHQQVPSEGPSAVVLHPYVVIFGGNYLETMSGNCHLKM